MPPILKIGAITLYSWFMDPWYRYTLATNFQLDHGGWRSPSRRPASGPGFLPVRFSNDDKKMAWAQANGLASEAGTGFDHGGLPRWVLDISESDAKVLLENKVRSDVSHFKGQELYWGVMNEVVNGAGTGLRNRQDKKP